MSCVDKSELKSALFKQSAFWHLIYVTVYDNIFLSANIKWRDAM